MKFQDMPYARITFEEIEKRFAELMKLLEQAETKEDLLKVLETKKALKEDMTVINICSVRHDMNINDAFYAEEQRYYDEISPKITELWNRYQVKLMASPLKEELKAYFGEFSWQLSEIRQKGFSPKLIPLMQEENRLCEAFTKLNDEIRILWQGKELKLNQIGGIAESKDRAVRKAFNEALGEAWEKKRPEAEQIFDSLVKNRDKQAKLLGYENYVGLGYCHMTRVGYGPEDVAKFREEVKRVLVPMFIEKEEERRKRLGLEHLYVYDIPVHFLEGNPIPEQDAKVCMEHARSMFHALSPETGEFIDFMMENGLYDVEIRDGKKGGGFMTFFDKYKAPFIFANFNGTTENAYIITHEGGHAFQGYLKKDEPVRERCAYTSETAETHAMAMEFFCWPYMELFFGDRAEDYRTMHLAGALTRIIYQCEQDEFQQIVYENPDMTPQERNALWQRLEKEYYPTRDYGENKNLADGCAWHRIPHTFYWPFYAIDYGLAQVCALQYKQWMDRDPKAAWESYLSLCKKTGSKSFPELLKEVGLKSPFEEGALIF